MIITIHCAGMPFNGETIQTKSLGGSETACYYVARELVKRGHKVTVFTNAQQEGRWDDVKYSWLGQVSEQHPLGDRFHFYAENSPSDVTIIQRHPLAFRFAWQSKINLWWLHDLGLYRNREIVASHLWNVDGILPVSKWHGKQLKEVYSLEDEIIYPIMNGVDLDLYTADDVELPSVFDWDSHQDQIRLLFAARPERGLENLVKPDGIMQELWKKDKRFHLYVCGYDNVTDPMREYYAMLNKWIEQQPNCTNIGALTKAQLAQVEQKCDTYVYPTTFEDTSCIMAMECAAAGLPFMHGPTGALPETTQGLGAVEVKLKKLKVDTKAWVNKLIQIHSRPKVIAELCDRQLKAASRFTWDHAAMMIEQHVGAIFKKKQRNKSSILRGLIQNSDIYAARLYAGKEVFSDPVGMRCIDELDLCYQFTKDNSWKEHYETYYEYEKERGVVYGPEDLRGNGRFRSVATLVSQLPDGCTVLDYGCAHGHYTINLAKLFPKKNFVGVDIAESNIKIAKDWATSDKVPNVEFYCDTVPERADDHKEIGSWYNPEEYCCIIAAEVLEHVESAQWLTDELCKLLKQDGLFIGTTPYGPWEYQGFKIHHPWRAHVHHFERMDLHDMYLHHPGFNVVVVPGGKAANQFETMGSYTFHFRKPTEPSRSIDYERKFKLAWARETISLCMILKDCEKTILRSLSSIKDSVDEIVLAVDRTSTDTTFDVVKQFAKEQDLWPIVKIFEIDSPLETGFFVARNASIEKASCDWIMWIDSDEFVAYPERIHKYLRNNQYKGYAMKQHHFAIEPLGVIKTDLPCRIFRNGEGVQFFGYIHEHPERKMNDGIGCAMAIPDVDIAHEGYTTDVDRKGRFRRNIGLMLKDRKKNPDRRLGKFLWMRDTAQMLGGKRAAGIQLTPQDIKMAEDGAKMWEYLLKQRELRMCLDGLQFYSALRTILGPGFEAGIAFQSSKIPGKVNPANGSMPTFVGFFKDKKVLSDLVKLMCDNGTTHYESKYW